MQCTFNVYNDPGHGWIKVPRKLAQELGILDKISSFSYQRGEYLYLEEDLDAATFLSAYEEKTGAKPRFREHSTWTKYSRIRGYERYEAKP